MATEKNLSSTMRIEISPAALKDLVQQRDRSTSFVKTSTGIKVRTKKSTQIMDSKYQHLLQSIYDGVLIADLSGKITDVNIRALDFLGHDRDELLQMNVVDILAGAEKTLLSALRDNLQNERFALIQAYCIRRDGTFFPAEIAVNLLKFADPLMCFFLRDISLRKEAEEKMITSFNAIQNAGTGIAIADVDGRLTYVNPSFLRQWGIHDQNDVLHTDLVRLWQNDTHAGEMVRAVLNDLVSWRGEMVAVRADGSSFESEVSATPNFDSEGDLVGMVLSVEDITNRKRAEEGMRLAEQHRAMLASLGAACHHLGQPATVLLANLEMLKQDKFRESEVFSEIIGLSCEAAERIAEILHKMKEVEEFRTTRYISTTGDSDLPTNRILDL
ncbi:MAG TPA: PAS domain S-box protein [Kiritimatiellia bacterium]|nr:PAS domain S-box protein [Kiritimatiellia bacterium]HNS80101.1 PAS domain S-box protein [Kiritimatiellia bacterium]